MKSYVGLLLCLVGLSWGCRQDAPSGPETDESPLLAAVDLDPDGGADLYLSQPQATGEDYFRHPDFFHARSTERLTILPRFHTMLQTTDWSCGDVAVLLVLRHFGIQEETVASLARQMRSMTDSRFPDSQPGSAQVIADFGTKLEAIHHYFEQRGDFRIVASSYRSQYTEEDLVKASDLFPETDRGNLYPTFESPEAFARWLQTQLAHNSPVIAEWSDWDGHWVDLIGLDNCGTPDFYGDDVLILADPFDTMDHRMDGYQAVALDRFFYSWHDRKYGAKPYQLQPFMVVEPNDP
ncbi:MAG: hypothetical protein ACI30I_05160 [Parabacteroides sp.]